MKITGLEPEISRYLLKGRNITSRSTGHELWYATDEMGVQESLEICFKPTETSMECIGFNYDKVTDESKFRASINLGNRTLLRGFLSPITVLSYLNVFNEPNVQSKLRSKFICKNNPFFEMDAFVSQTVKTDYGKETIGEWDFFWLPKHIPEDLKDMNQSEEQKLWDEINKIKKLNSELPSIKSKERLFEIVAELKMCIERANIKFLDITKTNFDRSLHR